MSATCDKMADTQKDCKLVYRMLTAYVTDINRRT